MARHGSYSIEFKRQVAQEYLGGESLSGLTRRHDVSRILIGRPRLYSSGGNSSRTTLLVG